MLWRLRLVIETMSNRFLFFYKRWLKKKNTLLNAKNITFICGFHGKSGGAQAIASIASMLSNKYNICFLSYPSSHFNRLLCDQVSLITKLNFSHELFICDLSTDITILSTLKAHNKKIIISIHGLKDSSHRLSITHVEQALKLADKIHFVSEVQQDSYKLPENKYFIIPNMTIPVTKTKQTNNIGSVGNLNDIRKGAEDTIRLGLVSNAENIHLWSKESSKHNSKRIVCHSWENNKTKIYNSFDILVFMSLSETFGLVVIEAMSAGIPCVLSGLKVFEQFEHCPGVILIDPKNKTLGAKHINYLLENKNTLAEKMKQYYRKHYSPRIILTQWISIIDNLYNQ
ncbi:MAG: hypothetical protein COB35_10835 [Gammaproteobacteria bacterium]|nr:MAG: hypothetical protein COB35_10835 [Gammaproteobacteria bacterium]